MITFPNAKINIGLSILRKRNDGFHDIETIFCPVTIEDILEVVENDEKNAKDIVFSNYGIEIPGDEKNNLCVKAFHLLQNEYSLPPVKVFIHKKIPMGAGLGGGSSDAAFMLKMLNSMYSLGISTEKLKEYAARLGSDCAFFIENKPAFACGRGEKLSPVSLSLAGYDIVLVCPEIHVGTAEAYRNTIPAVPSRSLREKIQLRVEEWRETIQNDFETSVFPVYPAIAEIKKQLYEAGAVYASMSGSGSSVYGLFKQADKPLLKKRFERYKLYFCFSIL